MTAARSSITIESRPLAGGRVRWSLYFRPALPDGTSLLPVDSYDRPEDRPKVEAFARPYREALQKKRAEPKPEDCDRYFERYTAYQKECGSTDADEKATRWNKWIAPTIGDKRPEDVTRADVEDIRDALDAAILAWEPGKAAKGGTSSPANGDERVAGYIRRRSRRCSAASAVTFAFSRASRTHARRSLRATVARAELGARRSFTHLPHAPESKSRSARRPSTTTAGGSRWRGRQRVG